MDVDLDDPDHALTSAEAEARMEAGKDTAECLACEWA